MDKKRTLGFFDKTKNGIDFKEMQRMVETYVPQAIGNFSCDQLRHLQLTLLQKQVRRIYEKSRFYRKNLIEQVFLFQK
jgi:phenylacetate-coenzyme A ligase PaaK-like adenylate-forming protein